MLQRIENTVRTHPWEPDHEAADPGVSPGTEQAHVDDLLKHLERLDLLVQRAVMKARLNSDDLHDLGGLMHPEDVIASPLTALGERPRWATPSEPMPPRGHEQRLAQPTRLEHLVSSFGLSPIERDLLLLGLLPWFDERYALLFAYLQGSQDKQLPSVALALRLLGTTGWDRTVQAAAFAPGAPLLRHRLVRLQRKGDLALHWGEAAIHVDRELYHHLAGHGGLGAAALVLPTVLVGCSRWLPIPELADDQPQLTERLRQHCFGTPQNHPDGMSEHRLLMLRGPVGSGRALAFARAAGLAGRRVLSVDLSLLPDDDEAAQDVLALACRETRLRSAGMVLRHIQTLQEHRGKLLSELAAQLTAHGSPVACLMEPNTAFITLADMPHWLVEMPGRSDQADEDLLRRQLAHALPQTRLAAAVDLQSIVRRFRPSPDALGHALREADHLRCLRGPEAELAEGDLVAAFRLRSQQNFGKLAQRITPQRTFEDLIVGDDLLAQLQEILAALRQRDRALQQGFARKVAYGTGISALFHGDSGTGKTMVAEVLAGALGVDLIKIDLSTVVNKYIGETEKNLSRIFDLAAADAGVLFFDEADALFGKRSEAKDAQDRYANIEVSYLLQRLEAFPGLVILATNNRAHLDEAFTRRLTFITRFRFPDTALRERLWRSIWPPGVRLAPDIDPVQLAARAPITGANIRNIALLSTWLAADEGEPAVLLRHVERALARELEKLGRIALN